MSELGELGGFITQKKAKKKKAQNISEAKVEEEEDATPGDSAVEPAEDDAVASGDKMSLGLSIDDAVDELSEAVLKMDRPLEFVLAKKDGIEIHSISPGCTPDSAHPEATLIKEFPPVSSADSLAWSVDGRWLGILSSEAEGGALHVLAVTEEYDHMYELEPMGGDVSSGIKAFHFSPLGTYAVCFEPVSCGEDQEESEPTIRVWLLADQASLVATFPQERRESSWPVLTWSAGEDFCCRMVKDEIQIYPGDALYYDTMITSIPCEGVGSFEVGVGTENSYIALFIPQRKGERAVCMVYSLPDTSTPTAVQELKEADDVQIKWNTAGTALLVLTSTNVDQTGKSYFGNTSLYFMLADGSHTQVYSSKDGPVHDVSWCPTQNEFLLLQGDHPCAITLHDGTTGKISLDFGKNRRNTIQWSPLGRFFALGGFGQLAGDIDFWDRPSGDKMGGMRYPCCVDCQWSADGRFLLGWTVAPRMRVENRVELFDYAGNRILRYDVAEELYAASWRPMPLVDFPDLPPSPRLVGKAKGTQLEAGGATPSNAYRAPKSSGTLAARLRADVEGGERTSAVTAEEAAEAAKAKKKLDKEKGSSQQEAKKFHDVSVPPELVGALIGTRGANIKALAAEAKLPMDVKLISGNAGASGGAVIRIGPYGPWDSVDDAEALVKKRVEEIQEEKASTRGVRLKRPALVSREIPIPDDLVARLIGVQGATIQELSKQIGMALKVRKREEIETHSIKGTIAEKNGENKDDQFVVISSGKGSGKGFAGKQPADESKEVFDRAEKLVLEKLEELKETMQNEKPIRDKRRQGDENVHEMPVPPELLGGLIGKKGSMVEELCKESGVTVKVIPPKNRDQDLPGKVLIGPGSPDEITFAIKVVEDKMELLRQGAFKGDRGGGKDRGEKGKGDDAWTRGEKGKGGMDPARLDWNHKPEKVDWEGDSSWWDDNSWWNEQEWGNGKSWWEGDEEAWWEHGDHDSSKERFSGKGAWRDAAESSRSWRDDGEKGTGTRDAARGEKNSWRDIADQAKDKGSKGGWREEEPRDRKGKGGKDSWKEDEGGKSGKDSWREDEHRDRKGGKGKDSWNDESSGTDAWRDEDPRDRGKGGKDGKDAWRDEDPRNKGKGGKDWRDDEVWDRGGKGSKDYWREGEPKARGKSGKDGWRDDDRGKASAWREEEPTDRPRKGGGKDDSKGSSRGDAEEEPRDRPRKGSGKDDSKGSWRGDAGKGDWRDVGRADARPIRIEDGERATPASASNAVPKSSDGASGENGVDEAKLKEIAELRAQGDAALAKGDLEAAVDLYTKCYRKSQNKDIMALASRSAAQLKLGKAHEAFRDASIVVRLQPDLAVGHLRKGLAQKALEQDVAQASLEECLRLEPSNLEAKTALEPSTAKSSKAPAKSSTSTAKSEKAGEKGRPASSWDKPTEQKTAAKAYSCGECGQSAELGAIDPADGNWYCKACWEALLGGAPANLGGAPAEQKKGGDQTPAVASTAEAGPAEDEQPKADDKAVPQRRLWADEPVEENIPFGRRESEGDSLWARERKLQETRQSQSRWDFCDDKDDGGPTSFGRDRKGKDKGGKGDRKADDRKGDRWNDSGKGGRDRDRWDEPKGGKDKGRGKGKDRDRERDWDEPERSGAKGGGKGRDRERDWDEPERSGAKGGGKGRDRERDWEEPERSGAKGGGKGKRSKGKDDKRDKDRW